MLYHRATAPRGARKDSNLRPHDRRSNGALHHRQKDRWGTVDIGFSLPDASLPCRHERPDPRRAGPRGTGSTARRETGGIRTRFTWSEVTESLHHQRTCRPPVNGGKLRRRDKAARQISNCVAALSINGAPPSEPCGSPRHRWTARCPRAPFPPAGPALLDRRAKGSARSPGSGSPVPPKRRYL